MPIPFFGSGAINYSLPASSSTFLPDRRLILSELLRPVSERSAIADYLAAIYRERLSAADLKTLRLDQLQWVWNFAPFIVDCIHFPPPSRVSLDEHACQLGEKAGAMRVAFNKGLLSLDKFGYGVPVSTTWCAWGPHAIEPYAEVQRALPGLGGNEHVLEVIRVSTEVYLRGSSSALKASKLSKEGGPNGCWYIARRGTGVFLRTGRTLNVPSRASLPAILDINASMLVEAARPTKKLDKGHTDQLLTTGRVGLYRPRFLEDFLPLCPLLRAKGYETLVLGQERLGNGTFYIPEVVSCSNECTANYLDHSCVPGLLTGFQANKRCECTPELPVVNCALTPGGRGNPFPNPRGLGLGYRRGGPKVPPCSYSKREEPFVVADMPSLSGERYGAPP